MSTASREYHLLLVSSLNLPEETLYFRILFELEENAVHLQEPLRHQQLAVDLSSVLITRIPNSGRLARRHALQSETIGKLDVYPVGFTERIGEIHGKFTL